MDEYDDNEQGEVFRRTKPVEEILRGVLTQFGVKKRAKEIMVERCRRASGEELFLRRLPALVAFAFPVALLIPTLPLILEYCGSGKRIHWLWD